MVIVGADVHKRTHTFVAVDDNGRKLGEKTVDATSAGHSKGLKWVRLRSVLTWYGESRTCGSSRDGWSVICLPPVNEWCGYPHI